MYEVLNSMARKPDESLKSQAREYTVTRQAPGGRYESQKAATEKYEEKKPMEKIIVRVPAGSRDKINEYVKKKAEENSEDLKYNSYNGKAYRPSVNALIKALLEEEMGITLE